MAQRDDSNRKLAAVKISLCGGGNDRQRKRGSGEAATASA